MYEPELLKEAPANLAYLLQLTSDPRFRRGTQSFADADSVSPHLLTNLRQFGYVPSPRQLYALKRRLAMSIGGVFKLFGYRLDGMRRSEELLNGHRTRIVESYAYNRDRAIDLPEWLAGASAFRQSAFLSEVIIGWQLGLPIRALRGPQWQRKGIIYAQIGTHDTSAMPRLPPGAVVAVLPIDAAEQASPNPEAIYFLQTGHAYLCASCVIQRGRLSLITHGRVYTGPQEFLYPEEIRIVGRVISSGVRLPPSPTIHDIPSRTHRSAALVLPWEQTSLSDLIATERLRFGITEADLKRANEILEDRIGTGISIRTLRRYVTGFGTVPQTATLLALTLLHSLRISDVLRILDLWSDESQSYSLAMLMNAIYATDLPSSFPSAKTPQPLSMWEPLVNEWGEWPTLLSMAIPDLSNWGHRILRVNQSEYYRGLDPLVIPHSVVVLDVSDCAVPPRSENSKQDWERPIYAVRYEGRTYCGYVEADSTFLFMPPHPSAGAVPRLAARRARAQILGRVVGVASPHK